jgi:hypothetical protein
MCHPHPHPHPLFSSLFSSLKNKKRHFLTQTAYYSILKRKYHAFLTLQTLKIINNNNNNRKIRKVVFSFTHQGGKHKLAV